MFIAWVFADKTRFGVLLHNIPLSACVKIATYDWKNEVGADGYYTEFYSGTAYPYTYIGGLYNNKPTKEEAKRYCQNSDCFLLALPFQGKVL